MSNSLLTIDMVTRKALQLFLNSNAFIQQINRVYDGSFGVTGAKIGDTLRIRLPNDYTVGSGATVTPQATNEQSRTITVATQANVAVSFTSAEKALSLDDYSSRVLEPAVNDLVGSVAADIMNGAESISNFVSAVDGSSNIISPTMDTWLAAGAVLDGLSAPRAGRKVIVDRKTQARTVSSFAGLFNNTTQIGNQYSKGLMGMDVLGWDFYMDQTVILHTTGAYSGVLNIDGANQTGSTLTVDALAGPLTAGDIITVAGVNAVNRVTKKDIGDLAQFVVTANVSTSATSIPIYPALTPPSGGNPVAFQTVTASPADEAVILVVSKASEQYRKNFGWAGNDTITMVTADLQLPSNAVEAASRRVYDGVSLRVVDDYITLNDLSVTRIDVLYGYLFVRPEWCVVVADKV